MSSYESSCNLFFPGIEWWRTEGRTDRPARMKPLGYARSLRLSQRYPGSSKHVTFQARAKLWQVVLKIVIALPDDHDVLRHPVM